MADIAQPVTDKHGAVIGQTVRLNDFEVAAIRFGREEWDRPDQRVGVFRKRRQAERAVREARGDG